MPGIIGADGNITMVSGHGGILRTWTATVEKTVSEVTPFSNTTMRSHRVGLILVRGSASGVPDDSATGDPGAGAIAEGGGVITLTFATARSWSFTAAITGITGSSDKSADAAITFDFISGDADTFTESWV